MNNITADPLKANRLNMALAYTTEDVPMPPANAGLFNEASGLESRLEGIAEQLTVRAPGMA